jgi:prepilin signal peptidase PulO-like enzyme (type II secretory pathway)
LLGTFFALHPLVENAQHWSRFGFTYLGVYLPGFYAYSLTIGLLALAVYCYAMSLVSHRTSTLAEFSGNSAYALAVMVFPLYGGLYLSSLLADRVHSQLAWAAPSVALGGGLFWFLLSQFVAFHMRRHLAEKDQTTLVKNLAEQEVEAVKHAQAMIAGDHYDLSVIETWRAVEARLRRILTARAVPLRNETPQAIIAAVIRRRLLDETQQKLLEELHREWNVAIGFVPVARQAAEKMLHIGRTLLAGLPADDPVHHHRQMATRAA